MLASVKRALSIVATMSTVALGCVALPRGATATAGSAKKKAAPYCPLYSGNGIPPGSGIPPWGFHAPQGHAYAHGWGNINLNTNWISGYICQDDRRHNQAVSIKVTLEPHIIYHTHTATMWGYPGNLIKAHVKVAYSNDAECKVGTHGKVTMYASYNGVRSDSIQFFFPADCRDQDQLYHGPQVDAQVPPL
jgi:hypothetical protein